jgi:sulfite exporter TauE/SafE
MTIIIAGVLLGLAGSVHCIGMCGPLVLAIGPRLERPPGSTARVPKLLFYHLGRISTYVLLALPAGLLGQLLSLRGLGRAGAAAGAVVLIGMAFDARRLPGLRRLYGLSTFAATRACASAARWGRRRPALGAWALGAGNGLMPCAMVYAAVAAAAATGSLRDAFFMMGGFGLGTMPALLALSAAAVSVPSHVRTRLARLTPAVLVLAAALLLARAFDVPYVPESAHAVHPSAHARH